MRAQELSGGFGLDKLTLVERPDPRPGPGQVLVRVRAVSLNYRDLLTVNGHYNRRQPLPLVPCSDAAGEVAAVGEGVDRVRPGDRVCSLFAQRWIAGAPTPEKLRSALGGALDGVLAELVVLSAEGVVATPPHLSDEEAATLPCAALTAWSALVDEGGVKAGDTVVAQGTGGVSIFGLQLARLLGARVIITSSSDEKLARARELGAAEGVNYRAVPEWGDRVKELAGGAGADLVLEVGGAGTFAQSLRAVRPGGQISLIGNLTGTATEVVLTSILMRRLRVQGILVGPRESFEAMNRAIALHRLHPVVDRVFPFAETRAAFEHMAAAKHFGKIVIRL
jgi:NADPH:quinone reductase-like Zn-dependent oxidoreductase